MTAQIEAEHEDIVGDGFTASVVDNVRQITLSNISVGASERLRHAVLDYLGVAALGASDPAAVIMRDVVLADGGHPVSRVIGTAHRASAAQAALCNGVAGHALDFDDTGFGGHPSVPVLSAVLSLADELGSSGEETMEAILQGYQAMALVSLASGDSSFVRGFHGTGTFGTFGAAAGCGRLLELSPRAMQNALGLAATQAAGLNSSIGTMGKPLNAAKAASNGLLAARLAQRGFTGSLDAIETARAGFEVTHNTHVSDFDPSRAWAVLDGRLAVELIFFKSNASCGGTFSTIESIRQIRRESDFAPEDVESVELVVDLSSSSSCNFDTPKNGHEAKYSLTFTAALALTGGDTGLAGFEDERVHDPDLESMRRRVKVSPTAELTFGDPAQVSIRLTDGQVLTGSVNPNVPVADSDVAAQWDMLVSKFLSLSEPRIGSFAALDVVSMVRNLHTLKRVSPLLDLVSVGA